MARAWRRLGGGLRFRLRCTGAPLRWQHAGRSLRRWHAAGESATLSAGRAPTCARTALAGRAARSRTSPDEVDDEPTSAPSEGGSTTKRGDRWARPGGGAHAGPTEPGRALQGARGARRRSSANDAAPGAASGLEMLAPEGGMRQAPRPCRGWIAPMGSATRRRGPTIGPRKIRWFAGHAPHRRDRGAVRWWSIVKRLCSQRLPPSTRLVGER